MTITEWPKWPVMCYSVVILLLLLLLLFFQCRHVVILVIPFQWVSYPLPVVGPATGDVTGVQVDREEGGLEREIPHLLNFIILQESTL